MMISRLPKKLLSAVAFCVVLTLSPVDAAVRPPRLQYELMTLPNGLTIVLSPDHSTPIVHVELWYHVGSKDEKTGPHRVRPPVRAHDVQGLEERGAGRACVDAREHRRAEQRLHQRRRDRVLADGAVTVPAAGAVDGSRSHGDAAHRQDHVRERARSRQGRAPAARRQSAVRPAVGDSLRHLLHRQPVQAHDDRQHEGSRRGIGRGRARLPQHVLRPQQRDDRHRRRLRHGAGQGDGDEVFRRASRNPIASSPANTRARSRRRPSAASR